MYNIERKSNNFCHTWKIKKGKTKNLNVVYLLKRINGLCNFNFTSKLRDPPTKSSPPNNINKPPTKIKISDPPPAKTFLKFSNTPHAHPLPPPPLSWNPQAGGRVHAMFYVLWTQKFFTMYKKMKRTEELVEEDPKIFMSLSEPGLVG